MPGTLPALLFILTSLLLDVQLLHFGLTIDKTPTCYAPDQRLAAHLFRAGVHELLEGASQAGEK